MSSDDLSEYFSFSHYEDTDAGSDCVIWSDDWSEAQQMLAEVETRPVSSPIEITNFVGPTVGGIDEQKFYDGPALVPSPFGDTAFPRFGLQITVPTAGLPSQVEDPLQRTQPFVFVNHSAADICRRGKRKFSESPQYLSPTIGAHKRSSLQLGEHVFQAEPAPPSEQRMRKRAKRDKERRMAIAKMSPCIRCRVYKIQCDTSIPCATCQRTSRSGNAWNTICYRINFLDRIDTHSMIKCEENPTNVKSRDRLDFTLQNIMLDLFLIATVQLPGHRDDLSYPTTDDKATIRHPPIPKLWALKGESNAYFEILAGTVKESKYQKNLPDGKSFPVIMVKTIFDLADISSSPLCCSLYVVLSFVVGLFDCFTKFRISKRNIGLLTFLVDRLEVVLSQIEEFLRSQPHCGSSLNLSGTLEYYTFVKRGIECYSSLLRDRVTGAAARR